MGTDVDCVRRHQQNRRPTLIHPHSICNQPMEKNKNNQQQQQHQSQNVLVIRKISLAKITLTKISLSMSLHRASGPTTNAGMDLYGVPPTDLLMEKGKHIEYSPIDKGAKLQLMLILVRTSCSEKAHSFYLNPTFWSNKLT